MRENFKRIKDWLLRSLSRSNFLLCELSSKRLDFVHKVLIVGFDEVQIGD